MDPMSSVTRFGLTAAMWAGWCVLHSLLNSRSLASRSHALHPWVRRYYRLAYTLIAVATLLLVWTITPRHDERFLWAWDGSLLLIRSFLICVGGLMLALSLRALGLSEFLGLSSLSRSRSAKRDPDRVVTTGIYGVLRHPQFLAALILLWARDIEDTDLVINIVLSAYLLLGARIEEKRLLAKFGERYRTYQRAVPGYIPRRIPSIREIFHAADHHDGAR